MSPVSVLICSLLLPLPTVPLALRRSVVFLDLHRVELRGDIAFARNGADLEAGALTAASG